MSNDGRKDAFNNGDGETKAFPAVTENSGAADMDNTKVIPAGGDATGDKHTIEIGESVQDVEVCEKRGSVHDYTAGSLIWRVLKPLLMLAASVALVGWLCITAYHFIEDNYFKPVSAEPAQAQSVTIKPGSSLSTIASLLYDMGIVRNKLVFQMYVDLNDMGSKLVAGTYDLSPSMSMDDIMNKLAEGTVGRQVITITLTEGMTANDMAESLYSNGVFDVSERIEFLALCNDMDAYSDYNFIAAMEGSERLDGRKYLLEGYLFPDTYEIYADATPDDIITKLLNRFDQIMTIEYEDRAEALGLSIDEVITLASMIEWEALPKDYSNVSAVFYNRLEIDMALGSCATLRYVTGEKKMSYNAEERDIDSRYNTYKYTGLPIGPVCNPGKKSIDAALFPYEEYMAEDYLYFCNKADDSGDLVFAKTIEEHNENDAAWEAYIESKQDD